MLIHPQDTRRYERCSCNCCDGESARWAKKETTFKNVQEEKKAKSTINATCKTNKPCDDNRIGYSLRKVVNATSVSGFED